MAKDKVTKKKVKDEVTSERKASDEREKVFEASTTDLQKTNELLREDIEGLKKERMVARRRATKAEKDADERVGELEESLEFEANKAAVYFKKMRKAQTKLSDIQEDVLSTVELAAESISTTHRLLAVSGKRLARNMKPEQEEMSQGAAPTDGMGPRPTKEAK
jgi:hypothetical protein